MLGLGTPASNGGLKAGDVLVQVELQMLMIEHWGKQRKSNILGLNLVSEQCVQTYKQLPRRDILVKVQLQLLMIEQREKTTMMLDADTKLSSKFSSSSSSPWWCSPWCCSPWWSSPWWCSPIPWWCQVGSKLVTMLTHPEAVQCIRSNVNVEDLDWNQNYGQMSLQSVSITLLPALSVQWPQC